MHSNKVKAFTLVELLIAVFIIAVLATLAIVSLNNARSRARDATRVADIKQIQTALELYYNKHQRYPVVNDSSPVHEALTNELMDYIKVMPLAPIPADGSCDASDNIYQYKASENSYEISYCLGSDINNLQSGTSYATPVSLQNQKHIVAFTNVGSHIWNVPDGVDTIDVLIVAGGGGGGGRHGAGGGAGGLIYLSNLNVSDQESIDISVGDGGAGAGTGVVPGLAGENSVFGEFIALGGGGGSSADSFAQQDGGSGGGKNSYVSPYTYGLGLQALSSSGGFGNDGGITLYGNGSPYNHAGGGGAEEVGGDASLSSPGKGGDGMYLGDIFTDAYGENGYFAGGGGGGSHNPMPSFFGNDGGLGGGGDGGKAPYSTNTASGSMGADGEDGLSNTGGGGGGASTDSNNGGGGGSGGSGIVLIRYISSY